MGPITNNMVAIASRRALLGVWSTGRNDIDQMLHKDIPYLLEAIRTAPHDVQECDMFEIDDDGIVQNDGWKCTCWKSRV